MHGPFRLFFFPIPVSGGARSSLYSIRRIPSVSSSSPLPSSERLPASVFSAHRSPLLSSFINRFCGADALALLCCVLSPPDCSRLCRDTTPHTSPTQRSNARTRPPPQRPHLRGIGSSCASSRSSSSCSTSSAMAILSGRSSCVAELLPAATASPGIADVTEQLCRLGLVASTCHIMHSTW